MSASAPPPVVYLDNAATSWPKPPQVIAAMSRYLAEVGANPGRSGHRRSVEAARVVFRARAAVARLLDLDDPLRVVLCANATHALNLAIGGLVRPGRHVITTGMEHNSVMRPLRSLEAEGAAVTVVPCSPQGVLDPADVERAVRPETALIVATHASNVVGTVLPVAELAAIARAHDALLLVDAAQSLGALPVAFDDLGADLLAFTGHKALLGPTGTGGLVVGPRVDVARLEPLMRGGTGSRSESQLQPDFLPVALDDLGADLLAFTGHKALLGPTGTGGLVVGPRVDVARLEPLMRGGTGSRSESQLQPDFLPDKFESGTLNVVGLAGLTAAVDWLLESGVEQVRAREIELTARLLSGLGELPGVRVYGTRDVRRQLSTVSFSIAGMEPGEVGRRLDDEFGVAARVGLHCSPLAHETLGTYPAGTVRFSLSAFTTDADIACALEAVSGLAETAGG